MKPVRHVKGGSTLAVLVAVATLAVGAATAATEMGRNAAREHPITSAPSAPSAPATPPDAAHDRSEPPIALLAPMIDLTRIDRSWRRIELHRNGARGADVRVTMGIPFPPGMLHDANHVRIVDAQGKDVPAHVEPTLKWHFQDGGIRAVRVQFRTTLDGDSAALYFTLDSAGATRAEGWPYADGLVAGPSGVRVPGVLATLNPQWMSASMIAGPQHPAVPPGPYDRFFARQFQWAKKLPVDNGPAWLFDRPTTLFQQYVRTGRADYLAAAEESYRFYMQHIRRDVPPGWPRCGGGFALGRVDACDPKYVYLEPTLLALGLTGDDSGSDPSLIRLMMGSWSTGGWNFPAGPYNRPDKWFTERETGLGLLATASAWEITGDKRYRKRIRDRLDWLYEHQRHNPDGLGDDGSWRNSWQVHEGDTYDAATDIRGTSPWMTQMIIDGLWHAWLVTGDARVPAMIADFGRYMETYGWIEPSLLVKPHDWRDPCSGQGGQISWYWTSPRASTKTLEDIQDSEGWYSDQHNVELTLVEAAAYYFERDPTRSAALKERLDKLASSYNIACASNSATPRRFNWNNRGTGVVQWLIRQPPGSGASLQSTGEKPR